MKQSDRLFGLIATIGALAYGAGALGIQTSFMSDPVGSKTFPLMIATVAFLCGIVMMLKPDDEPEWPVARSIGALIICAAVLVGYAYALKPGGFLVPTALASGILSFQISGKPKLAVITGVSLSVGLFVVFKFVLGLSLFGLPRWLMG